MTIADYVSVALLAYVLFIAVRQHLMTQAILARHREAACAEQLAQIVDWILIERAIDINAAWLAEMLERGEWKKDQ